MLSGKEELSPFVLHSSIYIAPSQQPWANRGAFGSISSKKRDKF